MSGDLWEYLILGALIWLLARRIRRTAEAPGPPAEQPWWDRIP
jgi:hypothetical protein